MSRRDDETLLRDMLDHARVAFEAAAGRRREELDRDLIFRAGVERFIQIIGEAASRVSSKRQKALPGVPWADIVGMRNRLVHGYAEVDLDVLWRAIRTDLPDLIELLEAELKG